MSDRELFAILSAAHKISLIPFETDKIFISLCFSITRSASTLLHEYVIAI